jgi:hypothetical protein
VSFPRRAGFDCLQHQPTRYRRRAPQLLD